MMLLEIGCTTGLFVVHFSCYRYLYFMGMKWGHFIRSIRGVSTRSIMYGATLEIRVQLVVFIGSADFVFFVYDQMQFVICHEHEQCSSLRWNCWSYF